MDILENKKINDDDYYKPIFTQTRSKKEKKSPTKKKSPVKKLVKKEQKTKKVDAFEKTKEKKLKTGV